MKSIVKPSRFFINSICKLHIWCIKSENPHQANKCAVLTVRVRGCCPRVITWRAHSASLASLKEETRGVERGNARRWKLYSISEENSSHLAHTSQTNRKHRFLLLPFITNSSLYGICWWGDRTCPSASSGDFTQLLLVRIIIFFTFLFMIFKQDRGSFRVYRTCNVEWVK